MSDPKTRRPAPVDDAIQTPTRRYLKIFASDPMLQRRPGNRITIDIPNERETLHLGPVGHEVAVIDYDVDHNRFYPPVDLNDPRILMQNGLDPSESDPRFHQQMVYAVAMRTLENFTAGLGRPLSLRRRGPLRLFPHAFHGANAFYHRPLHAVLFGYFQADRDDPGENLPGQIVFTCLSHDIIVHEVTHAIVQRIRPLYFEASNKDVLAFHEGFSDMVALFQRFSFDELLRIEIARSRGSLEKAEVLVNMAQQFGYATGAGKALRSAIGQPDRTLYQTVEDPHERGAVLVAAVFDAFLAVYQARIQDLIRISTGGSGRLPEGDLHPDLVNRVAAEATRTARNVLSMCIRALDYLPPVDVTFGDFLRALVTADFDLNWEDPFGQRAAIIESFRQRGIYAQDVISLAEESLIWEPAGRRIPKVPTARLKDLIGTTWSATEKPEASDGEDVSMTTKTALVQEGMAKALESYAKQNSDALHLDESRAIRVNDFYWGFRSSRTGQLVIDFIVQFVQADYTERRHLGGLPYRGGTTVVADAGGSVRYVISKPIRQTRQGRRPLSISRLARQRQFVEECDRRDPQLAWCREEYFDRRMAVRMDLAALHSGLIS